MPLRWALPHAHTATHARGRQAEENIRALDDLGQRAGLGVLRELGLVGVLVLDAIIGVVPLSKNTAEK